MYNYFRQDWIVARIHKGLRASLGGEPLVFSLPFREQIESDKRFSGFTLFIAGDTNALKAAFARTPAYWLPGDCPPGPSTPNGFVEQPGKEENHQWQRFGPARLAEVLDLIEATDDWPFLYLRQSMIPDLYLRGVAIIAGLAILLFLWVAPGKGRAEDRRAFYGLMFFSGAAFMLIETRAIVSTALLFGSTWIVNAFVFLTILVTVLAANLFVLLVRPQRLWPSFVGLFVTVGLSGLLPLDTLLGMSQGAQLLLAALLTFSPVFFAGIIFARVFSRSTGPDRAFGINVAGAMVGGLMEYTSMFLGFRHLMLLALGLYLLCFICYYWSRKDRQTMGRDGTESACHECGAQ